ncbi:amidohydrolase [Nocardia sp. NPDC057227]|uniref:amidohydrolase n=1 Tax=Nocardia sp. NPDC057227 TaxID=3346056 RepID=UPI003632A686
MTALRTLYEEFHRHPEVAFAEYRTTARIAELLTERGLRVSTSDAVTGVVGSLVNGDGPVVALRADIDALPITERTGLPYTATGAAMHACGHDVHITALIGAIDELLAARDTWSGTLVAIFQPAEEVGNGARTLTASGIFDGHPVPDVVLGHHNSTQIPAGHLASRAGVLQAGADTWQVTLRGPGGHAAAPHRTADLIVLAATIVLRLQTIVAREVPPDRPAVVTVGSLHGGTVSNIIPDTVTFTVNARSFDDEVRGLIERSVARIVRGEAAISGLEGEPEIEHIVAFPRNVNDPAAHALVHDALSAEFGAERVGEVQPLTGSEDFGDLGTHFGVPSVFWFFGGGLAPAVAGDEPPPNGHSPRYAPDPEQALPLGVAGLVTVARRFFAEFVPAVTAAAG